MTATRIPLPEKGDIWQDDSGIPFHVTNVTRAGIVYGLSKGRRVKYHFKTFLSQFHPMEPLELD